MSKRWTAAIAAATLGAGLLLGAAGGVLAGSGSLPGMMGSGGGVQCDASHMGSHMTSAQMTEMMGSGAGAGMMGSGTGPGMMGSGMGSGLHSQHHGTQP
jgi:hypothetical protein